MINAIKYELQIILSGIKVISNFCLDYASLASYGVVHFYCRLVQPIDAIRLLGKQGEFEFFFP